MKIKSISKPLGMGAMAWQKHWVFSAIGAATGLASSIYGGIAGASAADAARRAQKRQEAKEEAWYNRRYNEDYADTAAGQNLVRRAKDFAKAQWKKAAGASAVNGATPASSAMAKEAGTKMVGDTIANIAATDQQRKEHADDLHRQAQDKFAQMDMQRDMQRAQNITNAASQASNALMTAGAIADMTNKTPITGTNNNGKAAITPSSPAVEPTTTPVAPATPYETYVGATDDEQRAFERAVVR